MRRRFPLIAFRKDERGAISLIFAFALLPLLTLTGAAIDYGLALSFKTRVAAAADSAALAGAMAAVQSSSAGNADAVAIAAANTQANRVFVGATAGIGNGSSSTPTVTTTKSNGSFTTQVVFSGSPKTFFGSILYKSSLNVGGSAVGSAALPQFYSYYLVLDVSGSMGVPSTPAGQARLAQINPDMRSQYPTGCYFACHFAGSQGYDLSRTNGGGTRVANDYCSSPSLPGCIQLRIDAVSYAVQQFLQTAQSTQNVPNQFAVGLFPFATNGQVFQPLTTSLSTVSAQAILLTSLLDDGTSPNQPGSIGSGGTHFDTVLQEANSYIPPAGNGSSAASPTPFIFMVTDGAQNNQYQAGGSWWGSNHATTIDPSNCATLKNRGVTVAVLYVPYVPIANPNPFFANDEDDFANANIANIPTALSACASPGWLYTANTPSDITAMMQAMFLQSITNPRLVK